MKPILFVFASVFLLALSGTGRSTVADHNRLYRFNYENVLGTSLELKISTQSEAQAHRAETAALNEISRESKILSSWDADSEFSRWTRTQGQPVRVSPELFEVLSMYDQWRGQTSGALDASAEAVIRVWKNAASQNRMPEEAELEKAVARVRLTHWRLDRENQTATHLSDTPLVLASFTKSYILSRAADAAMKTGVRAAVVNIGGDLMVRGALTEPVTIADPRADAENDVPMAELMIHDEAVATSGDYRRGFDIGGRHFSHIVDPRTGMPATEVISSTVIAPDAAEAGALATAFSVMKPEESRRLAGSIAGVEYLLVNKDGEHFASPGWSKFAVPGVQMARTQMTSGRHSSFLISAAAGGEWDPSMELTIHVELPVTEGFAKRPYLAAWVENPNGTNLRTISVWYRKPRYLDDLRAWYRTQDRIPSPSVSSATRGPGTYTIDWDGKDDAGNYVKAGKYSVFLEVVREHGGYQLMHQDFDFTGTPRNVSFPANSEVASASFDYHKR